MEGISDTVIKHHNFNVINVINPESDVKILMCGHIDEVGLYIEKVNSDGWNYSLQWFDSNGEIIEGEFPVKAKAMVKEFILKYQNELLEMWETEKYVKLPPLN